MASTYQLPIHVEVRGEGPTVMLIHGFAASAFTWRHWAQDLMRDHQVVLVDLKGHGAAPAPGDGRYSPMDHAELVYRQLVQLDLSGVTLVGHSMGGAIALLVALRCVERDAPRISRLALIAGAAYPQPLPPFIAMARGRMSRMIMRLSPKRWLVRRVLESIVHDPSRITDSQVRAYAEPLRHPDQQRAILATASQLVPKDAGAITSRFSEIDLPTLLLWGDHDRVVPRWVGERLATTLPNATLEILEHCGHLPPEEKSNESVEVFRAFLSDNPRGSP